MNWRVAVGIGIALLIGVVLWQRNTITAADAKIEAAKVHIEDLVLANEALAGAVELAKQQRVDNDAIAAAVAARMAGTNTRLVETRTIIQEAIRDEPAVADWGAVPVPGRVREALRPRKADPAPR